MKKIAVIDLSIPSLSVHKVPTEWDSEQIEEYLDKEGYHLSNCSWGEFEGEINIKY